MDVSVIGDARVCVVELSAARQAHGQEGEGAGRASLHAEGDARDSQAAAFAVDDKFSRVLHGPPELDDARVLLPPAGDHVLYFLIGQILQCAAGVHPPHGTNPSLVSQGQGGYLAALPVAVVRIAFDDGFHRNTEHFCCCGFVNFARGSEHIQHPFFPGLPGNEPGFDGGEVCVDEYLARLWNQRGADHLAQYVADVAVDHLQRGQVFGLDELAHFILVLEVSPGQVLHLEQSACPAPCPGGAVELQRSADAPVGPCGRLDGIVFLEG